MSLFATKDSLMSLREAGLCSTSRTERISGVAMSSSLFGKTKRSLPLHDLQERVTAKRRRLSATSTSLSSFHESPTAAASPKCSTKSVSFDLSRNREYPPPCSDSSDSSSSCADNESSTWMSSDDFRRIRESIVLSVTAFRQNWPSDDNILFHGHAVDGNMRGLEHRATIQHMKEHIRRGKRHCMLVLQQQEAVRQQQLVATDNCCRFEEHPKAWTIAAVSLVLSADDQQEAIELAASDAKQAVLLWA